MAKRIYRAGHWFLYSNREKGKKTKKLWSNFSKCQFLFLKYSTERQNHIPSWTLHIWSVLLLCTNSILNTCFNILIVLHRLRVQFPELCIGRKHSTTQCTGRKRDWPAHTPPSQEAVTSREPWIGMTSIHSTHTQL